MGFVRWLIASQPRVCARSEPVVSDSCSTSAGLRGDEPSDESLHGYWPGHKNIFIFQTTRSPPYQPLRSPPITMPGFSRRPLCHTAALVEHVSETTGSGRAQTRAVWQRGRRENPPQPSYQFFLFYIQSAPNTAPQAVNTSHSDKKHPARSPVVPPKYFIAFR